MSIKIALGSQLTKFILKLYWQQHPIIFQSSFKICKALWAFPTSWSWPGLFSGLPSILGSDSGAFLSVPARTQTWAATAGKLERRWTELLMDYNSCIRRKDITRWEHLSKVKDRFALHSLKLFFRTNIKKAKFGTSGATYNLTELTWIDADEPFLALSAAIWHCSVLKLRLLWAWYQAS